MKKLIYVFITFLTLSTQAALDLKPGLWKVKMKMSAGGKELNPMAHMQAAMGKLSLEQRKQMETMMKSMKGNKGAASLQNIESMSKGEGISVCYTEKSLAKEASLAAQKDQKCKHSNIKHTSKKIEMTFECEDGSKGKGVWTILSKQAYQGEMQVTRKDGKSGTMFFDGQFASENCGDVKPNEV